MKTIMISPGCRSWRSYFWAGLGFQPSRSLTYLGVGTFGAIVTTPPVTERTRVNAAKLSLAR